MKKAEQKERFSSNVVKADDIKEEKIKTSETVIGKAEEKTEQKLKSKSKAAGLKSTLVSGKDIYLTSFGKGNKAVVEHKIDADDSYSVTKISEEPTLSVNDVDNKDIRFSSDRPFGRDETLLAANPIVENSVRGDNLGLKEKLEKKYFGKTFNDNIHIQIIYNIMDIEKILAVYSTSIATTINGMLSDKLTDDKDFIGYMSTKNTYDVFLNPDKNPELDKKKKDNINDSREKFEDLLKTNRLGYFGFDYKFNKKNPNESEENKKRIYHLMGFAGSLRQWSVHNEGNWIYKFHIGEKNGGVAKEYLNTLNHYFKNRYDELNNNFIDQNKVNLFMLIGALKESDPEEICSLYREFIIEKTYKNMGFSIKKLRENMLTLEGGDKITDESMNSVRSKLYKLIDFCIYYGYYKDEKRIEENVRTLRACMTDSDKEMFYEKEAERLWAENKNRFIRFANELTGSNIKKLQDEKISELPSGWRNNVRTSEFSCFSKLMYCMCFFLDGKEINDLLTTLINKFDVIVNLVKTAKEIGIPVEFDKKYTFFNYNLINNEKKDISSYVDELNTVKNIARMKKPSANAKETMYRDALYILGIPSDMSEKKLGDKIADMLDKSDKNKRHDFRNFIANNVINSSRFIYIIKYCDPKSARKIASNRKVVEFVLKESMPESIIERYYKSCIEPEFVFESDSLNEKIMKLSKVITEMNFGNFEDVDQRARGTLAGGETKTRYIAVIGLYLNVVYQIVKNLVNVNARYVMGFHSLERDMGYMGFRVKPDKTAGLFADPKTCITRKILEEGDKTKNRYLAKNMHYRECIKVDIDNSDESAIHLYRNNVAHLKVIKRCALYIGDIKYINSYFGLYHYIMQRCIADDYKGENEKTKEYLASLSEYNTYVGDFVKALNAPFGYNAPRFKNLSIEGRFDKNSKKKLDK